MLASCAAQSVTDCKSLAYQDLLAAIFFSTRLAPYRNHKLDIFVSPEPGKALWHLAKGDVITVDKLFNLKVVAGQ